MKNKKYFIKTISMTEKGCPFCEGIIEVYTVKGQETRLYSYCLTCGMLMDGDVRLTDWTEKQDEKNEEEFRRYKIRKKLERKGK